MEFKPIQNMELFPIRKSDAVKLIREEVIRRWDALGLLEGLTSHVRSNIAELFENQQQYIIGVDTAKREDDMTVVMRLWKETGNWVIENKIPDLKTIKSL